MQQFSVQACLHEFAGDTYPGTPISCEVSKTAMIITAVKCVVWLLKVIKLLMISKCHAQCCISYGTYVVDED